MENNKMLSFKDIIQNIFKTHEVYIPLIQRNYKWDADTASGLASDLWDSFNNKQTAYTIGMITFYKENDQKLQLIDGQQRIITLYMLLEYLQSLHKEGKKEDCFTVTFERDDGIKDGEKKREVYLRNISECSKWNENELYTDIRRFKENYKAIEDKLKNTQFNSERSVDFIKYIKSSVYFLLHISETEPFDEFMNLNNNKTRFVISDRIKANLIIDFDSEKKSNILTLFSELSYYLFSNEDVWNCVSQGYTENKVPEGNEKRKKNKLYPDENRLKLLCCDRYGKDESDVSSILGYCKYEEFKKLKEYKEILAQLADDIKNKNWNSYNAFICLYKLDDKEIRFFKMLSEKDINILEECLINQADKMSWFQQACFIASQFEQEKSELKFIDDNKNIKHEENKDTKWFNDGSVEYECFKKVYKYYIEEKYERSNR